MEVRLDDIIVTKTGDSNEGENCNLYGVNAALLMKDGAVATIKDAKISSNARGASGVFSYGGKSKTPDGTRIDISNSTITTNGTNSGGIMTTGGGITNASDLTINTTGDESAPIRSDQGGGTVNVEGGTYISNGVDSPAVYSMADIKIKNAVLTSNVSSGVVIRGRNKVNLQNCILTANNFRKPYGVQQESGIMIFDTNKARGTAEFIMTGGTINNVTGNVFTVTNNKAKILLDNVSINNTDENNVLIAVDNDNWEGSENAATFEMRNMVTNGKVVVNNAPSTVGREGSSLTFTLSSYTTFTGSINAEVAEANRGSVNLVIRQGCKYILNETSYVDSIVNNGRVVCGDYDLYVNGEKYDDGGSDYPTESTLILYETEYDLQDETGKIIVDQEPVSKVISVNIKESGHFTFKGNGLNTVIQVSPNVHDVKLILDELTIDNTTYQQLTKQDVPIISFSQGACGEITTQDNVTLIGPDSFGAAPQPIIRGDTSTLIFNGSGILDIRDSTSRTADFGERDPIHAISDKEGEITFKSGVLNIDVNGSAIKCKAGTVTVDGGIVNVAYAGRDAISARDGVININSGRFDVSECLGDGINSQVEDSENRGSVNIFGGELRLYKIYEDGIQSENVNITGGDITITTMYNSSADQFYTTGNNVLLKNTIYQVDDVEITRINVFTGYHSAIKAGRRGKTYTYEYVHPSDTEHEAGVIYIQPASGSISISGGNLIIDTRATGLMANVVSTPGYTPCSIGTYIIGSPGNGLESYNTIAISGGSVTISAAGNGIQCDGAVTLIDNADVSILTGYDGIKGGDVIIGNANWHGDPKVKISPNGCGIHTITSRFDYTYADSRDEDCNYTIRATQSNVANDTYHYSGSLEIEVDWLKDKTTTLRESNPESYAKKVVHYRAWAYCLDCEGLFHVDDGQVELYGQGKEGRIPVDTNDGFACNMQAIMLVAGIDDKDKSLPRYGNCAFIWPRKASWGKDAIFIVRTTGGDIIYNAVLKNAGSFLVFAHPALVEGTKYDVTIGDKDYLIKALSPTPSEGG